MTDTTSPRRRRTNDPQGLRRRVLDTAAAAFQSKGYEATSVHDLQRKAGISGGALHHHFPSKRSLAIAVIAERVVPEVQDTWFRPMVDAPSAASGIMDIFDTVIGGLEDRGSVGGCPLGNLALELSLADEDLRAAILSGYTMWRAAIEQRLRGDLAAGKADYARHDVVAFADLVVALFSGALVVAKAEQSTRSLRACEAHLRSVMRSDLAG